MIRKDGGASAQRSNEVAALVRTTPIYPERQEPTCGRYPPIHD